MASKCRKSRNFYLLPSNDDITGAKLPSNQQVLSYFLHRHKELKETIRAASTATVDKLIEFWNRARIPTRHKQDIIKKVEKTFSEWQALKKNATRRSEKQQQKEASFTSTFNVLFDVAHADALSLIKIEEDKAFLIAQREPGRHGTMIGVDKSLEIRENVLLNRKDKAESRKRKSDSDIEILDMIVELESSSGSSAAEDTDNEEPVATQSAKPSTASTPKRGRKQVMSPSLNTTLDRSGISDRKAMMIVSETAKSLGHNIEDLTLNRSSIRRKRRQDRQSEAKYIQDTFDPTVPLTVHWDGKLLPDLTGSEKVDRLPVIVSGYGVSHSQLLSVPKIPSGSGQQQAHAVERTLHEWGIAEQVRSMCFDTTSSNTGRLNGACVLLEQALGRDLLHLPCRHHIMELIAGAAFWSCMGCSSGPEIQLFKRFKAQWNFIDTSDYRDAHTDAYTETNIREVRKDLTDFINHYLQESQPRDDYREFLELVLTYLGSIPERGVKFMAPGAMHQARWMSKVIYTFKVWMFRHQFRLTEREEKGIRDLCIFYSRIYLRAWFQAPLSVSAPRNDLHLLQELLDYADIHKSISVATSKKLAAHLWYLSEVLIGLALFDADVSHETKSALVQAMKTTTGEEEPLVRISVDLKSVHKKTLPEFATTNTMKLFRYLDIPTDFLDTLPSMWHQNDDFKQASEKLKSLSVINDHAERGVALVQDFNGRLTHDEEQLQYLLLVVAEHRKKFPDVRKQTMMNKMNNN